MGWDEVFKVIATVLACIATTLLFNIIYPDAPDSIYPLLGAIVVLTLWG